MPAALSQGSLLPSQTLRLGVWKSSRDSALPAFATGEGARDGAQAAADDWQAEWLLKRNCSLAPRQLFLAYLAICLLSLSVAGGFWLIGAVYVMPFAFIELMALGAALLVYARHATDREFIGLRADLVRVECHNGGRLHCVDFNPRWVRVEPQRHDGSLIRLSGHGRTVDIGRHVQPGLRRQLAEEFRWALRQLDAREPQPS
jgi:uncharacterized membrane protein